MKRSVVLLFVLAAAAEEICLTGDSDPYLYFGTETAYTFAHRELANFKSHDVPGCSPMAFWLLYRPSSHNPEAGEINDLQDLVKFRNDIMTNYRTNPPSGTDDKICNADQILLEQWTWNPSHTENLAGVISSDGYMSTQQMAQTWRQKYPGLLTGNPYNYMFKYAKDQLSRDAFRSFTEGLFGAEAESFSIPKNDDETLSNPYKSCAAWTKNVEENNETYTQKHIFESKMDYKQMITRISRRLGFRYNIDNTTVKSMYQMCRYQKAWNVAKISPWCAVFTKDELKRLEYAEDLETYYKYGYGQPLHKKIGCLPVKDMYNFFTNHISQELPQMPLSMVTIASAPMLLTTLATLNTHEDLAPPTGDNFNFLNNGTRARKWTTSTMAPYNGNIAAVLYKCTPNGNFQINEQYQVLFLENEKPMYIDGCRVGLCDWSLIKNRFTDLVTHCDLEFCNGARKLHFGVSLAVVGFLISRFSLQM